MSLRYWLKVSISFIVAEITKSYLRPSVGALYAKQLSSSVSSVLSSGIETGTDFWSFDASRSNPIYGASTHVQPAAIAVNVFILAKV